MTLHSIATTAQTEVKANSWVGDNASETLENISSGLNMLLDIVAECDGQGRAAHIVVSDLIAALKTVEA